MGIINSIVYQPPAFKSIDIERIKHAIYTTPGLNGEITYVERFMEVVKVTKEERRKKMINVLYCHGNAMDMIKCDAKLERCISKMLQEMTKEGPLNFDLFVQLHIWEYPTYSISTQTNLTKEAMFEDAKTMWDLTAIDSEDAINICIGASIGTAFACSLCSDPVMDLLILQCPFSSLPNSVNVPEVLSLGRIFDNIEELKKRSENVNIYAILSETDDVMVYKYCDDILPYVDGSIVIGKTKKHNHKAFFTWEGFEDLGVTLKQLVVQHPSFQEWLAYIQPPDPDLDDDILCSKSEILHEINTESL